MDIDTILNKIEDKALIENAFSFVNEKLSNIDHIDKKTLMEHILGIVNTLLDFNADSTTIASALIYETLNYGTSKKEIEETFNNSIANITFSIAKINYLEHYNYNDYERYLKETLVKSEEDVRALFVKLAEKYYILKNLQNSPQKCQKEIANGTLSTLVPTASRLGLNFIRSKLEDLCLYYSEPEIYNEILSKLNSDPDTLNARLNIMKKSISDLLEQNNINCTIKGRIKNIYSIYNKLCSGKSFEDIYDFLALRILTDNEADCQQITELIHSKYKPIARRFKDYINNPKENMYQSIHTTIIDENGLFYEIQIRTYEMNKNAETGNASHYLYKTRTKQITPSNKQKPL